MVTPRQSRTVLNEYKPYGNGVKITKHECVGHVQKRLGKRVRAVKKELASTNKGPKERIKVLTTRVKNGRSLLRDAKADVRKERRAVVVGGRGRGGGKVQSWRRLRNHTPMQRAVVALEVMIEADEEEIEVERTKTVHGKILDTEIDMLQSLYRKAIVVHPGDLAGMTTACWAVYYHYISTSEDPQHDFCPDGPDSWCKYQQALATDEDPPSPPPPPPPPPHLDSGHSM